MLSDAQVIRLRRHARVGRRGLGQVLAGELGVDEHTISRAIRGKTYAWLNEIEPPVLEARPSVLPEEMAGARRLIAEGTSKAEVARRLGITYWTLWRLLKEAA